MFKHEPEILESLKVFSNKKALIDLTFLDGDSIKVIGILTGGENVIYLKHSPDELPIFDDLMAGFEIQLFKPTPFLTLMNITRYHNGKEAGSDQTGVAEFTISDPLDIYDTYPSDMLDSLSQEEGNTVVISVESNRNFPCPPFQTHTSNVLRNGRTIKSKNLNGFLEVNNKELIINNIKSKHYPKFDLGYEPESDFKAIVRFRYGYTLELIDKINGNSAEMNIEGFKFYGQNN